MGKSGVGGWGEEGGALIKQKPVDVKLKEGRTMQKQRLGRLGVVGGSACCVEEG